MCPFLITATHSTLEVTSILMYMIIVCLLSFIFLLCFLSNNIVSLFLFGGIIHMNTYCVCSSCRISSSILCFCESFIVLWGQLAAVYFHRCMVIHGMVSPQLQLSSIDSDLSLVWCVLKNAAMSTFVYESLVHRCMGFSEAVVLKVWLLHL